MAEDGPLHQARPPIQLLPCSPPGAQRAPHRPSCVIRTGSGGLVAQSAVAPPGPIPNPVVTHRSAGEYCGVAPREARPLRAPPMGVRMCAPPQETENDCVDDAIVRYNRICVTRGGAAVARW